MRTQGGLVGTPVRSEQSPSAEAYVPDAAYETARSCADTRDPTSPEGAALSPV